MQRGHVLVAFLGAFAVACPPVGAAVAGTNGSGISGRIQEAPTCPVEHPGAKCAPRALLASVRIHPVGAPSPAVTIRSNSNGRFRVTLAPGSYVLRPLRVHNQQLPRPPAPSRVEVVAGQFTHVTITYDTGIR
jgi:hypothetical protein